MGIVSAGLHLARIDRSEALSERSVGIVLGLEYSEAVDIGCEDYFYSGSYCFVEWPELIAGLLPDNCCQVFLRELPDGRRQLTWQDAPMS